MTKRNVRLLLMICLLALCVNIYFTVQEAKQRSQDYEGMAMFPYYLATAFVSYEIQFHKQEHPNAYFQPGHLDIEMAFSAFQASQSLFSKYGYHTGFVYYFFMDLVYWDRSDSTAYSELSAIKDYLPLQTYIKPKAIQPLLDAIAQEYKKVHRIHDDTGVTTDAGVTHVANDAKQDGERWPAFTLSPASIRA